MSYSAPTKSLKPSGRTKRRSAWRPISGARPLTLILAGAVILAGPTILAVPVTAQQVGNVEVTSDSALQMNVPPAAQRPSPLYYNGLELYRNGDLKDAGNLFERAYRSSRRTVEGRWLDAIPSLAMLAECHWQLGNLEAASQYLDEAFLIAARNAGWLGRVHWNTVAQTGVARSKPSYLWAEAQQVAVIPTSSQPSYQMGDVLDQNTIRSGRGYMPPTIVPMDVLEIMRGLAIATYRRRVIAGPLADRDGAATRLYEACKIPAGLQFPFGRSLITALLAGTYFSRLDDQRAMERTASSALFNRSVHPLSAIAMLTRVSASASSADPGAAISDALQTVHISAALGQPEFIGEALQIAIGCADEASEVAAIQKTAVAVADALLTRSPLAAMHCRVVAADAAVTLGNVEAAQIQLRGAETIAVRGRVQLPRIGAYHAYVAARVAAASGSSIGVPVSKDIDAAMGQLMSFALGNTDRKRTRTLVSMPRLFQMGLISQLLGSDSVGGATASEMLQAYCEDPPLSVWRRDPVDALASVMVDKSVAYAARVKLAAVGRDPNRFLLEADAMLAGRFTGRLPLGGRIAQVRMISRSDDELLTNDVIEFRDQARHEIKAARAAAMAVGKPNQTQVQNLEAAATLAALSRTPIPQAMPPRLDPKQPIALLPPRTGLLTYLNVGNSLFGVLGAEGKVTMWNVQAAGRVPGNIQRLLGTIGVGGARGKRLPDDESWKEIAVTLRRQLIPDEANVSTERFDELIIVPDGPLWYLPFELLTTGDVSSELLGDQIAIRYAATPGLALRETALPPVKHNIGIVAGPIFAPREPELNESVVESIIEVIDDPVRVPEALQGPSGLFGDSIGHFVVAARINTVPRNPLAMQMSPDDTSVYGTLAGWMQFPAEVPRSVILAGLRTPVDVGKMGTGEEVFMAMCALKAAGVRDIMFSRWLVGGESTAIAMRELLQELPFIGMTAAWDRARQVLRRSALDPSAEPLLGRADQDRESLDGNEPLFWSGYMVSARPSSDGSPP